MKKLWMMLFCLPITTITFAENWQTIGKNKVFITYFDNDSIQKTADEYVVYRIKYDYYNPLKINKYKNYYSDNVQFKADCKNNRQSVMSATGYTKTGKIIQAHQW